VTNFRLADIVDLGLDLDAIESCVSYVFTSEDDLIRAIQELNSLYVLRRDELNSSMLNSRLASAYLYLYLTTNVPKLFKVLSFLPKELILKIAATPWIDFGSGPATYTLAWYAWLQHQKIPYPKEGLLIEKDPAMQEIANKVLDKFLHHEDIKVANTLQQKKLEQATLFFGHSCNELSTEVLLNMVEDVKPKFILFLEPGTPEVFKKILEIRTHLLSRDFKVHYPCLQMKSCPMKQTDNWCHQYLHLRLPSQVERLTQLASLKRQHSAVIFHVYERVDSLPIKNNQYRIVQGPMQNKGAWTWQVCSHEGKLMWMESLTRNFNKQQLKVLETKVPGEIFSEVQIQKEIKPQHYRVLIGEL
jgi:ribosomal protein RSM22 (predicted rRNA methylase)